jgi:hypothetical protein
MNCKIKIFVVIASLMIGSYGTAQQQGPLCVEVKENDCTGTANGCSTWCMPLDPDVWGPGMWACLVPERRVEANKYTSIIHKFGGGGGTSADPKLDANGDAVTVHCAAARTCGCAPTVFGLVMWCTPQEREAPWLPDGAAYIISEQVGDCLAPPPPVKPNPFVTVGNEP